MRVAGLYEVSYFIFLEMFVEPKNTGKLIIFSQSILFKLLKIYNHISQRNHLLWNQSLS